MYKHLVLVVALSSLCCFMYGVLHILWDVEKNACQMTYMLQPPRFIKIRVDGEEKFPKYNLYTYAEGRSIENARSLRFSGAPVIFVPGNSGSYKQGRSLASTALRKALDNDLNHHLDYFMVDYNEELSALFGGYLSKQKEFLKKCIFGVLKLYAGLQNAPKQVVLIGHSMGGKIAQSLLSDVSVAPLINTIIFIATPIDRPVINFDVYMEATYRESNDYLLSERTIMALQNDTNCCTSSYLNANSKIQDEDKSLDDKLLISIGGGNRDLLVHAGLTYSKFSDINVMTSAIPNVWLSTDHVASVWCLQLVLVINRFLFSIIHSTGNRQKEALSFVQDKSVRLAKASYYFVSPKTNYRRRDVNLMTEKDFGEWYEDSRRVFTKDFENGLDHTYLQMIPLVDKRQYKKLYADVLNLESDDWVFGCDAKEFTRNMRYCSTGFSMSHLAEKLPYSPQKRTSLSIDLHKIKKTYPSWSHIVLRILPTRSSVKLNIDIHDLDERTLKVKAPKWFSYTEKQLVTDSSLGVSHYKILVSDLDESYQSINFYIKPKSCSKPSHNAIAKTCVPWAKGSDRYQNFSELENKPLSISVPISKPLGYNSTENPVTIYLHLDSNCRYQISYQNSFGGTVSRIVRQYAHWLPAHLTAILFLSFKYQVSLTPNQAAFKCGKLHSAIVHSGSFFIITVTPVFAKLLQSVKFLPDPDNFHHSMVISFVIHGTSSALLLLSAAFIWTIIVFNANIIHSIFLRLTRLSSPVFAIMLPIIERFPVLAGGALIAIGFASCGGISLILGCLIYFMLISKQYEDYLEKFVYNTVMLIASKVFGKQVQEEEPESEDSNEDVQQTDLERTARDRNLGSDTEEAEKTIVQNQEENENAGKMNSTNEEETDNKISQEEDEELERLLNEAIEKQNEALKEKQEKKRLERMEYDSIQDGLISVHFHMTLFLLMCLLTILFIPTTISWAKDFRYSNILSPDPSIIPATVALSCVFILWQISAPKNLYAYNFVASISYVCAAICVIYCRDSVYRLNGVICSAFIMITAHQLFSSKKTVTDEFDPAEAEIKDRIEKMRAVLADANTNKDQAL